jgi:3-hydroxybutyryl-CoA dehydrogenase
MAPGIAAACSTGGADVVIVGRSEVRAAQVADSIGARAASLDHDTISSADLVIESIIEDAAAKRRVLTQLDGWLPPQSVLASNTSSLSLKLLGSSLSQPQRFIGLHFLNPADQTAVVEVIPGPATSQGVLERVASFVCCMGKKPLTLHQDYPGYIWNRLQFAVLRECLHMLRAGIADAEAIDAAVADGLAPRWMAAGPLATAQLGGRQTFQQVAAELFPQLAKDQLAPPELEMDFYNWKESTRERLVQLREDALAVGRSFTERRPL